MYRVLIVEDDRGIAQGLTELLSAWGFESRCAENFRDILAEFRAYAPHLVLLDVALPCFDGYHWCQTIRRESQTPIVFLTSAGDRMNLVMAMNLGGDDFISKPFDSSVLMAKLQAILRRAYDYTAMAPGLEAAGAVLRAQDGTLEIQGNRVELTKNEFRILLTLLQRKGQIVSRETLMEALWDTDAFVDDNTLTVNVNRLRKTLAANGVENLILTRHGIGYLIPEDA